MLRGKTPLRKRKRIIKKIIVYSLGAVALLILLIILFILFEPKASFISPLPKTFLFQTVDQNEKNIKQIKELLSQKQLDYQSVSSSQSSYIITLKNRTEVVISEQKGFDQQISSLQFILSRLTMEGKSFTRLDLRFERPVINFQ